MLYERGLRDADVSCQSHSWATATATVVDGERRSMGAAMQESNIPTSPCTAPLSTPPQERHTRQDNGNAPASGAEAHRPQETSTRVGVSIQFPLLCALAFVFAFATLYSMGLTTGCAWPSALGYHVICMRDDADGLEAAGEAGDGNQCSLTAEVARPPFRLTP
jgi:hypothetical protein